jgi:thiamine biosynthesis lipoprotein
MSVRSFPRAPEPVRVEHRDEFACFGGICAVAVTDGDRTADAAVAVAMSRSAMKNWHQRFSRFVPDSEISRLNRDPRVRVPASPLLRRLVSVALDAARRTGGLVDATLGAEIVRAGYSHHFEGQGVPLDLALRLAPPRSPAAPNPSSAAARMAVDDDSGTLQRPRGVMFDPGGIAKGVFADELARMLDGFDAYAVDCAGDVRWGGSAGLLRDVHVASPFGHETLHTFRLAHGAIATSGIGKRSWLDVDGRPAHHLLDPRSGRPAFTGLVQATALAPTAAEAETLAKAAVLSGPAAAPGWLPHGGLFVREDGSYEVVRASGAAALDADEADVAPVCAASHPRISVSTSSRSGSLRISWNRPG